jgi:hypothetical protein
MSLTKTMRSNPQHGTAHRQWIPSLLPLLLLLALGLSSGFANVAARLANDDQAYYIIVARNLFCHGPTYDGLYLTNGVHPLHAMLLGAVYWLFNVSWANLGIVAIATCVCCGVVAMLLLLRLRAVRTFEAYAIGLLLSSPLVFPVLYRGMEGALALLTVVIYFTTLSCRKPNLLFLTVASVALWAARLELVGLPPIVAALEWQRSRDSGKHGQNQPVAAWLMSLGVLAVYLLVNYLYIGSALPISAIIKQAYPKFQPYFAAIGGTCLLLGVASMASARLRAWANQAPMTHALIAFSALFYLSHVFGQILIQTQTWYYFLLPTVGAFALLELGVSLSTAVKRGILGFLVIISLVSLTWEARYIIPLRAEARAAMSRAVNEAKAVASPGDRFMGPGSTALLVGPEFQPFSHDGLVGGVEQLRARRTGRLMEFAYQNGVRFIFFSSFPRSASHGPHVGKHFRVDLVSQAILPSGGGFWANIGHQAALRGGGSASIFAIYRLSRSN